MFKNTVLLIKQVTIKILLLLYNLIEHNRDEEPEPEGAACVGAAQQKKSGARAAKNMRPLYRLLEDIRKLYICYSSLGKIVSFYG